MIIMSVERGGPSEEEILKHYTERTLSDARHLQEGAKYIFDRNEAGELLSEPRLEFTKQQIEKAHREMEEEQEAPDKAKKLVEKIALLTDNELGDSQYEDLRRDALYWCKKAKMRAETEQINARLARILEKEFEDEIRSNMARKGTAGEWLEYLYGAGDEQAIEQAWVTIEQAFPPDSKSLKNLRTEFKRTE